MMSYLSVKPSTNSRRKHVNVQGFGSFIDSLSKATPTSNNVDGDVSVDELVDSGKNCIVSILAYLSSQPEVCSIGPIAKVFQLNYEASWIVQSGKSMERPFSDKGLDGKGQVVAVSDTGVDTDNCYFYDRRGTVSKNSLGTVQPKLRKVVQYFAYVDGTDYFHGHGTHVCGSIVGKKANVNNVESTGMADGIATGAKLAFFDIGTSFGGLSMPMTSSEILDPGFKKAGAKIHSASWGNNANNYGAQDADFDDYLYDNEDYLILVAAGNSGQKFLCKGICTDGVCKDGGANVEDLAQNGQQCPDTDGDGAAGWDWDDINYFDKVPNTVGSPANAKNIISVGASQGSGTSINPSNDDGFEYLAAFSSRGPTADNRIKPDLVSPGAQILSAGAQPGISNECDPSSRPQYGTFVEDTLAVNKGYGVTFMQGTSMATPVTAGTAALVRQYFEDGYYPTGKPRDVNRMNPSGALVKAVLMNSGVLIKGSQSTDTQILPTDMYDFHQGFGRTTINNALKLEGENDISTYIVDRKALYPLQTESFDFTLTSCSLKQFSVMLVWVDPQGPITGAKVLMNDMDLYMTLKDSPTKMYPNGRISKDSLNNAERIRLDNLSASDVGKVYTVTVEAKNLATSSQKFALVASGCFEEPSDGGVLDGTNVPTRDPTSNPSGIYPTASPTGAPTFVPFTATPTIPPPSGKFCEIAVEFKNLLLYTNTEKISEGLIDDALQVFQESVATIAGTNVPTFDWVCYVKSKPAEETITPVDPVNPGTHPGRKLSAYSYIEVDFTVSARVPDKQFCASVAGIGGYVNPEENAVAVGVYNAVVASSADGGTLQSTLRSLGSDTWLWDIYVSGNSLEPSADELVFMFRESTEKDRSCSNWEYIQWLLDNLALFIGLSAAAMGLCCVCCCVGCMVCRGNKKRNAASKQYKANNNTTNMQSYSTTNKIHHPQQGGNVSMTGYKGQQTRNPSAAQPQYQQHQQQQQPPQYQQHQHQQQQQPPRNVW